MVDFEKIHEKSTTDVVINGELRKKIEPMIDKWIKDNCRGLKYELDEYLTIHTNEQVFITDENLVRLPDYIHFGVCDKFVFLNCIKLETLEGGPTECKEFSCNGCIALKSFDYCPVKCDEFHCAGCGIFDLTPIPRKLRVLGFGFNASTEINIIGCPDEIETLDIGYTQFEKIQGIENCKITNLQMSYNQVIQELANIPACIQTLEITHCKKLVNIFNQPLTLKKLTIFKSDNIAVPSEPSENPVIITDIIDYDPAQFSNIQKLIELNYLKVLKMNDF